MSCCPKFYAFGPVYYTNYSQAAYSENLNKYAVQAGYTPTTYSDFVGTTVQNLWYPTPDLRAGPFFAGDELWLLGASGWGSGDPIQGTFEFALHRLQPGASQSQEWALTLIFQDFGELGTFGPDVYENRMDGLTVDWSPFEDRLYAATHRIKGHVTYPASVPGVGTIYSIGLDGSYSVVYEESDAYFDFPTVASDGAVWWTRFSPTVAVYRKPLGGAVQQLTLTGDVGVNFATGMPLTTPFGALMWPATYNTYNRYYMMVFPDGTVSRRPCTVPGSASFNTHSRDYKKTYLMFSSVIYIIDWGTCGSGWSVGGMAMG